MARFAAALSCLLWLGLLAGHAGTWWWPLDLLAHFRVQYAVLFLLCALVLLKSRAWPATAAALLGTAVCAATVIGQTGAYAPAVAASTERFRLVTFNVHHGNRELAAVAAYLQDLDADAIVLLELTEERVHEIAGRLPAHPHVYAKLSVPHYGAALLSRWPIVAAEAIELVPGGSRAARMRIEAHGRTIAVVGVHLHWPLTSRSARLRNAELGALAQLAQAEAQPLLIGGDLNVTPWSPHFHRMLDTSGLEDCARGRGWLPTWPSFFPPLGIRIDHCLASGHWRVLDVRTGPSLGSDHYITINDLELRLDPQAAMSSHRHGCVVAAPSSAITVQYFY